MEFQRKKKTWPIVSVIITIFILLIVAFFIRLDIKGHYDGLFLLRTSNRTYTLTDDLYVGDGDRIIYGVDFDNQKTQRDVAKHHKPGSAHLYYEWDEKDGSGYIQNSMADGTVLFTSFGRLYSETRDRIHGLLVGGTLAANVLQQTNEAMDESGMAFFNGDRWFHIWCNVNESIVAADGRGISLPAQWQFLGSRVIDHSSNSLVIASSHLANIKGIPLKLERVAYFFANEPYFILSISFMNTGSQPIDFIYAYGDEPWLGDYGSSKGNVGWVKDTLIQYEGAISPSKNTYAGFYHFGNDAINEGHDFTKMANFIEWFGPNPPSRVYFSDNAELLQDPTGAKKIPLQSNERFIGLEWQVKLFPLQTYTLNIAVGKAGYDPKTNLPVKPTTQKAFRP
jgi:hypothetical protein